MMMPILWTAKSVMAISLSGTVWTKFFRSARCSCSRSISIQTLVSSRSFANAPLARLVLQLDRRVFGFGVFERTNPIESEFRPQWTPTPLTQELDEIGNLDLHVVRQTFH